MSTLDQLYAKADERRAQGALNYAGALLPAEAFELLQLDPSARLVDVRTAPNSTGSAARSSATASTCTSNGRATRAACRTPNSSTN